MAVSLINEINGALSRFFEGGCALAKDSEEISRFIPALRQLGGQIPIFNALADRLNAVISEGTPEALIDAQILASSLRYTQLSSGGNPARDSLLYAETPLSECGLTYLQIRSRVEFFQKVQYYWGGEQFMENFFPISLPRLDQIPSSLEEFLIFLESAEENEKESYNDPCFYGYYVQAIRDHVGGAVDFLKSAVAPSIGGRMLPVIEKNLDPKSRNAAWFARFLSQYKSGKTVSFAEEVLKTAKNDSIIAETLEVLGNYPECEKTIRGFCAYKKSAVRLGVIAAFVKMADPAGWNDSQLKERLAVFENDSNEDVRAAYKKAKSSKETRKGLFSFFKR
jgi:hypothetical protein